MVGRDVRRGSTRASPTEVRITLHHESALERSRRLPLPAFRIGLARWAGLWERLWPELWPTVLVVGIFLVLALFDVLPLLNGWVHLGVLGLFAVALAYALGRAFPAFVLPDRWAGMRRIERSSGLAHRPLTAIADRLASGDTDRDSAALWRLHVTRMGRALDRLRVGAPRPGLARRDPIALRGLLGLLLIVAMAGATGEASERLQRAVTPTLTPLDTTRPPIVSVSITPPAYTGIAPLFLEPTDSLAHADAAAEASAEADTGTRGDVLSIPQGSTVLAQVDGGSGVPSLQIGDTSAVFAAVEADVFQAKAEIQAGAVLAVDQDSRRLAEWPITVVPDQPPAIAFAAAPWGTERKTLRLAYEAADDYGLAGVTATIRRADGKTGPGSAAQIDLTLPLPSLDPKSARQTSYHDLTPHPWAGLEVNIQLQARDAVGQVGTSDWAVLILPERTFRHPIARAVIEQRKRLIVEPGERLAVSRALFAIAAQPSEYADDIVVALGLRVAQRRLIYDPSPTAIDDVQALLWDLALRIEEGKLSIAERDLRAAQQALMEALAGDASDEEIERLMNELQEALDRFLAELAEQMQRQMAEGRFPLQPDPNIIELQRDDLQRLIEQARELARSGARQAARDMLAQLQEMLENLRALPFAGEMDPATAEALKLLEDMEGLTERQKQLLDRTFQEAQRMQPGDPMRGPSPGAAEQEALRRALGEIMRRYGEMMGDIPRPLGRAERAMRDAVGALEQGMPNDAVDPQSRALSELQQGTQDMANALMEQLQRQAGPRPGEERFGQGRDPLGRNESSMGMIDTGYVEIPDQSDVQRAKEIIDELRRRAGERTRPKQERDYIERLLKRF